MALLKVEPVVLEGRFVRLEPTTLDHAADLALAAAALELLPAGCAGGLLAPFL